MTTDQLFHEVVERHGSTVLRVCASTLGPGADAEDAWAEAFVAALAAFPFDGIADVEAWLVRVARFKCIDVLRARRRTVTTDPTMLADDADVAAATSTGPAAGVVPSSVETWDDELWGHVATLSERQQFVVVHRYVGQWTYPEIAEKLGCSPAAARRCGADAIAALRGRMQLDAARTATSPAMVTRDRETTTGDATNAPSDGRKRRGSNTSATTTPRRAAPRDARGETP